MFKRNAIAGAIATTVLTVGSASVMAQQSVNSTATITVQNAFTLTEDQALNFGTVIVQGKTEGTSATTTTNTTVAALIIPADGSAPSAQTVAAAGSTTAPADSTDFSSTDGDTLPSINILVAGQRGLFGISGTAPFSPMQIQLPTTDVTLSASGVPSENGDFVMNTFTAANAENDSPITLSGTGVGTITTDAAGAAQFAVGATIETEDAPGLNYEDAAYTGNFLVEVSY